LANLRPISLEFARIFGDFWPNFAGEGAKVLEPTPVLSLSRGLVVQEVACGSMHSLARSEGGAIWATGDNEFGQVTVIFWPFCIVFIGLLVAFALIFWPKFAAWDRGEDQEFEPIHTRDEPEREEPQGNILWRHALVCYVPEKMAQGWRGQQLHEGNNTHFLAKFDPFSLTLTRKSDDFWPKFAVQRAVYLPQPAPPLPELLRHLLQQVLQPENRHFGAQA
jgi:hypothetical protein